MSELGIARQNIASANVQSQVGAEGLQTARGERKGDAATAVVKSSDLTDIQEEIGNAVGKFADKKTLGQAKLRQGAGVNIEALKRIADYYDKLPDMPRDAELRVLVGTLQNFQDMLGEGGGGSVTAEDILEALRDFDGDVTHQFEALQVAQRYFEANGASPALLNVLDQAERAFDDPNLARDVQAGYTIAAQASDAAPSLETSPAALRNAYREMLRSQQNMGQLFDKIADFNIRFSFGQAVDLFLTAAGNELADTNSQTDPVLLGALVRELGALKEMRTVFEEGNKLVDLTQRIDPKFATGPDAPGPIELTSALLNFSAKQSPSMADTRNLVKQFEPAAESTMVVFANGLQDLHRLMSDRSVISNSARVQQGTMIESLRIELSAAEEAAFAAENT